MWKIRQKSTTYLWIIISPPKLVNQYKFLPTLNFFCLKGCHGNTVNSLKFGGSFGFVFDHAQSFNYVKYIAKFSRIMLFNLTKIPKNMFWGAYSVHLKWARGWRETNFCLGISWAACYWIFSIQNTEDRFVLKSIIYFHQV